MSRDGKKGKVKRERLFEINFKVPKCKITRAWMERSRKKGNNGQT